MYDIAMQAGNVCDNHMGANTNIYLNILINFKLEQMWHTSSYGIIQTSAVCYVTVGMFFPTWDGGPMITMLEDRSWMFCRRSRRVRLL